jgi:hypothetical protein
MKKRWTRGACEARVRAIVRAYGPVLPIVVAERLWPDSRGWGSHNGRGTQSLARNAGRILHRLREQGLVESVELEIGTHGRTCRRIHWRTVEGK